MPIPVLICDDSSVARKQMARALPPDWDVTLSFASNGEEALRAIADGKAEVMFLDLTMPMMNGYEVLEEIRQKDLPCLVVVVSGDIQQKARETVLSLGALEFMAKPIDRDQLREVLSRYGLLTSENRLPPDVAHHNHDQSEEALSFDDILVEVVNIAMGSAGSRLGDTSSTIISLPVPAVYHCQYHHLPKILSSAQGARCSAASQGFCGLGISGEAIVLVESQDLAHISKRLGGGFGSSVSDPAEIDDTMLLDTLIELCSILAGSCLNGISEQLDLPFNHSYPVVLGHRKSVPELLGLEDSAAGKRSDTLAIEISYRMLDDTACHLLLLITADSMPALEQRIDLFRQGQDSSDDN